MLSPRVSVVSHFSALGTGFSLPALGTLGTLNTLGTLGTLGALSQFFTLC